MRLASLEELGNTSDGRRLVRLDRDSSEFAEVEEHFIEGWHHPNKERPDIQYIFKIGWSRRALTPYFQYREQVHRALRAEYKRGNEKLLFHGTNRACLLGESSGSIFLCDRKKCSLCSILRNSFDVSKCGSKNSFKRFGHGIYTTSCSSKADDYVRNLSESASLCAMILCCVVVGRPLTLYRNSSHLTGPPSGYHSIAGEVGLDLNYAETVTYENNSARPAYVIIYGDEDEDGSGNSEVDESADSDDEGEDDDEDEDDEDDDDEDNGDDDDDDDEDEDDDDDDDDDDDGEVDVGEDYEDDEDEDDSDDDDDGDGGYDDYDDDDDDY